jgi:hypothetical protein
MAADHSSQAGAFREWLRGALEADGRFDGVELKDLAGDEGEVSAEVWAGMGEKASCYAALRPPLTGIQVGFVTPDRWMSQDLEHWILDMKLPERELLALELEDVGASGSYDVDHFRDFGGFRFCSEVPAGSPGGLDDPAVREEARRVLLAYQQMFRALIDKA